MRVRVRGRGRGRGRVWLGLGSGLGPCLRESHLVPCHAPTDTSGRHNNDSDNDLLQTHWHCYVIDKTRDIDKTACKQEAS